MKAYLVKTTLTTRVAIPEGYNKETTEALATNAAHSRIMNKALHEYCENTEIDEDLECPYDPDNDK